MRKILVRTTLALCWAGALLPAVAVARELVLVSMSTTPTRELARSQPLVDYLAAGLKDQGITGGRVVVLPSLAATADALRERRADFVIASPYPTLAIGAQAGTRTVLRRWKNGKVDYHGLFVARRTSPLASLADLRSRTIAFESAQSTSGFVLQRSLLVESGLRLREIRRGESPAAGEVSYVFSAEAANAVAWVLHGKVDAAGIGVHDWESLRPAEREQLKVLRATDSVPRHLVSVRGDLEPGLEARLVQRLASMDSTEEGRRVLAEFDATTRFDAVPDEARRILERMRRTLRPDGLPRPQP